VSVLALENLAANLCAWLTRIEHDFLRQLCQHLQYVCFSEGLAIQPLLSHCQEVIWMFKLTALCFDDMLM